MSSSRRDVPESPFRGLASFGDTEIDALLFFGRERDIQTIAANLIASRFTVLYGASGVGKSSVLSAGVVRNMRERAPETLVVVHREWAGDPLAAMTAAIPGLRQASGRSLADAIAELAESQDSEIYLVLDQFEDALVHGGSTAFASALAEVVTRPGLRAHVLLAVREDALSELDVFTGLIPNVFGNHLPLDRLDRESARAAITGPVARIAELAPGSAVEIEPGLVEAVLDETAVGRVALGGVALGVAGPGSGDHIEAPYLQLVMQRLWEVEREQGSDTLRRSTLDELGGARGILRAHLDRALAALDPDEQDAAARMFHHLVTPSGGKVAHRVGDLAEYADVPEDEVRRVLAKLAPRRIVRPLDGSVELYHDVLADAVLAWRVHHDAERRLAQQRAASHARQRRLAIAVGICLVALAAMAALTVFALTQRRDARSQAREARAKRLDALASALVPVAPVHVDPELGLLLAARAARLAPDPPADDILRRALLVSFLRRVLPDRGVTAVAFSTDRQRLAVGNRHGVLRVYGSDLRTPVARMRVGAPILRVALDLRGRRLLTVAKSGPAVVWDVASRRRVASLGGAPTRASFSPDGSLVLTVEDREVRIWRASDGAPVASLPQAGTVRVASFTPRGDEVVVGAGRIVRTFKTSGGGALVVVDHGARVTTVAVTPDAQLLVTGGADSVVRVWALREHGRPLHALRGHRGNVTSLALVPGRPVLVSTSTGGFAREWDLRDGQSLHELIGHTNRVTGAALDAKGSHVLTWSTDGTARVWTLDDGKLIASLAAGHKPVTNGAFGPGGIVVTTGDDGLVRLWRPPLEPRLSVVAHVPPPARAAAFTRDGRRVAVGTGAALVVFDSRGRRLARLPADPVRSVALSDDGERVAYATGRRVLVRRTADGSVVATFVAPRPPAALAFAPDGRRLAVADAPGAVKIVPLDGGRLTPLRSRARGRATSVAFDSAGNHVAAGFRGGAAVVWPSAGGVPLWTRPVHATSVLSVAFSRSGRLLVTAGLDSEVHVWDAGDGRRVADLSGHFAIVSGAAFSPDAKWVVSAGPGTAGLWDVTGQQRLLFLDGHDGRLLAATFDPGGRRIETVGVDGTIRAYNCAICGGVPGLLRLADARLAATGRRLTAEEAHGLGIG